MSKETKNVLTLDELQKAMNKKYGDNTMITFDEHSKQDYDVISTGSMDLNLKIGIGGYPRGRIVEMYGWESSGKSTLCLHAISEATNNGIKAAYIDAEHAFDIKYARSIGVNVDNLYLSQPSSLEQALNIAVDLAESGNFGVIIIDSLSSLVPQKELDGIVGDSTIGIKARVVGQFLRKINPTISKNNVLLVLVGQMREKIGVMYGDPSTTDYGNSVKFYASIRLKVSKTVEKDGLVAISNRVKVKIEKNKCAPPFNVAEFSVLYGTGIDSFQEKLDLAVAAGIILRKGSWFSYKDTQLGQGLDKVSDLLKDNVELQDEIFGLTYTYFNEQLNGNSAKEKAM